MMIKRYAELGPDQLSAAWRDNPVAICPWGALEWHGPHLPLGVDGLIAERFCELLAARANGVLMPCMWAPITTVPHRHSLSVPTAAFRQLLSSLTEGLFRSGARTICIVSGHYAQGHEIELYDAAIEAMDRHPDLCVLAASPLEVLYTHPSLVKLDRFPGMLGPREVAVLGDDPRTGSADDAKYVFELALNRWVEWIQCHNAVRLADFYRGRRRDYDDYVSTYFKGSWEEAIRTWWRHVTSQVDTRHNQ
jgi:creatinine amidohydrolase